jgi:hypothetical protein
MELFVRVLRELVDEEFHKRIDVLASDRAGADRRIAIAVADVDGLV